MTNHEKIKEVFPKTIFIFQKNANDETTAIMCSDEWLDAEYTEETNTAAGLRADTVIIDEAAFTRERDAKLLTGFIDVLSREMCLNKEIAAKLADDYLNIKSLTSKEYL